MVDYVFLMSAVQQSLRLPECRSARPFVKWAGGKSKLLPVLEKIVPQGFGRYFEPFLGGGAYFFALRPPTSVLNDLNPELMNTYEVVRDRPQALLELLQGMHVGKQEFLRWRSTSPDTLDTVTRAARFIFLNKTCFNGLYRVNQRGEFNTPFGRSSSRVRLAEPENIIAASEALQSAELRCESFEAAVATACPGDFVYFDPPYVPIGRYSDFKRYTPNQFSDSDQWAVAETFRELDRRGCFVLLSNSKHPAVEKLFKGFFQRTVKMPRFVNCKGEGRGAVEELLVSNYEYDQLLS